MSPEPALESYVVALFPPAAGPDLVRRAVPAPRILAATVFIVVSACAGTPSVAGRAGVAPSPSEAWTPPPSAIPPSAAQAPAPDSALEAALPPDLGDRIRQLTLPDIVAIGLSNNSATKLAWDRAQAAAAAYGSARGAWLPTIDGDVTATRIRTTASQGRTAVLQSVLQPSVSLSYLVFDLGGRSGSVAQARQDLYAADFTHNATIQNVVLQVEVAYFQYIAERALLLAQRTTVKEAQENLAAAEERRRVGLATIADVLQARTAASQAELASETTEGNLQTARGALALSLGLPANAPYDIDSTASEQLQVHAVADSVDALIDAAVKNRPDLNAARAQVAAARAQVSQRRASLLPSLQLSGTAGRTYATTIPNGANSYNISLGLHIPLFAGFSRRYDVREAQYQADAAAQQTELLRQQVVFQVFSSYYDLQTSTRRVATAEDLLASATQSNEVALARYKAGVGTVLDLLTAQSALADARAQRVQARLAWSTALAQLAHDAGLLDTQGGSPLRLTTDTTKTR